MNITFVIGNGFDLRLGMRCRYGDFCKLYRVNSMYRPTSEAAQNLTRNAKEIINTWSAYELVVGECSTKFNAENSYLKCVQEFQDSLTRYLNEEEDALDFTGADTQHRIAEDIKHVLQYFGSKRRLHNDACQKLIDNEIGGEIDCNFLSFNYTSTLQTCLNMIPNREFQSLHRTYRLREVQNVHGSIRAWRDHYGEPPIMGVNNKQQIANEEFRTFAPLCKQLVKPDCIPREKRDKYCDIIRQSDLICIYGMSLGKTDAFWWREIGSWLKQDRQRQLVIYWYDERNEGKVLQPNQRQSAITYCRNRFTGASPELGWRPEEEKRIHVAVNDKLFGCEIPRRSRP